MENDDRRNGPILTKVESTQIFGNIEEIYHLHLNITEQLDRAINEDNCIGSVFLDNVSHLLGNYTNIIGFIRDVYRSTGPDLLNVFHTRTRVIEFVRPHSRSESYS
jgi:hypothetical protein